MNIMQIHSWCVALSQELSFPIAHFSRGNISIVGLIPLFSMIDIAVVTINILMEILFPNRIQVIGVQSTKS